MRYPLHMTRVAGVDGTPKGWAVVIAGAGQPAVRRVRALVDIFEDTRFDIVGCKLSRASSRCGKAISKQTYAIVDKIREVDRLLQERPELRRVVREVHPEVCFCQLVGKPMTHSKGKSAGRDERRAALGKALPQLDTIVNAGCRFQLKRRLKTDEFPSESTI